MDGALLAGAEQCDVADMRFSSRYRMHGRLPSCDAAQDSPLRRMSKVQPEHHRAQRYSFVAIIELTDFAVGDSDEGTTASRVRWDAR